MTEEEKIKIERLKNSGVSCNQIANIMGISLNSVKSYCKRRGFVSPKKNIEGSNAGTCKNCGNAITQNHGRKHKSFCSDKCRYDWWNKHISEGKEKNKYSHICPNCGKKFYARKDQKYCCHSCYISSRFGGAS